ncbi:MAG: hypothetical protein V3W34_03750 [Phycisphaerae bacterium]
MPKSAISQAWVWVVLGAMTNAAMVALAGRLWGGRVAPLTWMTYAAAGGALLWTLGGLLCGSRGANIRANPEEMGPGRRECLLSVCDVSALTAGIVASLVVSLHLLSYGIRAAQEVMAGGLERLSAETVLRVDGLLVIALLIAACLLALWSRGDRRLVAALFALFLLASAWFGLSLPFFRKLDDATWQRTGASLTLLVGLSVVLCAFVGLRSALARAARWRAVREHPDGLLESFAEWPAFRKTAGAVGLLLILLISYELASWPMSGSLSGRARCAIITVCAVCSGTAMFRLFGERWSANFADAAMGLLTLGVGAWSLLFLPTEPEAASERFPLVFNSLLIAFAVMTWLWVWLGRIWLQQLDHGKAWTAGGRLSAYSPGFGFFVACVALVNGSVMAFWPRFRSVGVFDDSVGRVAAGMAGYLLLLLVLLWSRRASGRASFGVLALLAVFSLLAFVAVRAKPLSLRDHRAEVTGCRWVGRLEGMMA